MLAASLAQSIRVRMRMDDRETVLPEEPPATVGARLRVAREAAGLGREDVSAQTKIAERHLLSIEEDRFSDLAARALGLDEGEIAEAVRTQLDSDEQAEPRAQLATFEPGDPARVPPARLAWPVAIGGVLTVVALLYLFWPSFLWPQGSLPDLVQDEGKLQPAAIATDTARQQVTAGGAVVFTATAPRVWVKFTDAEGNQLFQKEMGEGERYGLPADAEGPLLWTARPDALEITVGGKSVARLSDKPVTMKDVPVSGEALHAQLRSRVVRPRPHRAKP
jgi:cytoskeleton protein RodZ